MKHHENFSTNSHTKNAAQNEAFHGIEEQGLHERAMNLAYAQKAHESVAAIAQNEFANMENNSRAEAFDSLGASVFDATNEAGERAKVDAEMVAFATEIIAQDGTQPRTAEHLAQDASPESVVTALDILAESNEMGAIEAAKELQLAHEQLGASIDQLESPSPVDGDPYGIQESWAIDPPQESWAIDPPQELSAAELPYKHSPFGNPPSAEFMPFSSSSSFEPLKAGSSEREASPAKSMESRISDAHRQARELFKEGYGRIEVETTKEVYDSVREFYIDHTEAMAAAEYLIDRLNGDVPAGEQMGELFYEDDYGRVELSIPEEHLPESVSLRESIRQMAEGVNMVQKGDTRGGAKNMYSLITEGYFTFNEISVGVSSVGDEQLDFAAQFSMRMIEKIHQVTGEPYPHHMKENINNQGYFKEKVGRIVAETKEKFNQEIRPASQLLLHNSPYINEVLQAGKLATRQRQDSRGKARHTTANWSNHSRLTHFSETLITQQYKEVLGGNLGNHDEHDEDKNKLAIGGTLAVPIAKVIEETPYARGAKYGSATAKEGLSVEHKITKPVSFYEGHFDGAYSSGGMDRVFLKSIDNSRDAQDYEYSTFNMRTDRGTAAYVLIDDQDAERYNVRNDTHEGRKRLGHTDGRTVPDYLSKVIWGAGEGIPGQRRYKRGEGEEVLNDIRQELDNNPEFKNKVVFPLRGNLYIDSTRRSDYVQARDGGQLPSD